MTDYTPQQVDEATETMLTAMLEAVAHLEDDDVLDLGDALRAFGHGIGIDQEVLDRIPREPWMVTVGRIRKDTRIARADLARRA